MSLNIHSRLTLAVAALLTLSGRADACAVCFGNQDSLLTEGMNMGILTLLLFILPVLGGFLSFIAYLAWRARHPLTIEAEC